MKMIKSLKHDYVWHKITEMIEHDVKNDPNEKYEVDDSEKVNVCSQLAFWMSFHRILAAPVKFRASSILSTSCSSFLHTLLDWKECSKT